MADTTKDDLIESATKMVDQNKADDSEYSAGYRTALIDFIQLMMGFNLETNEQDFYKDRHSVFMRMDECRDKNGIPDWLSKAYGSESK